MPSARKIAGTVPTRQSHEDTAATTMFPFWDLAIAPIIEAVGAKRVVEIGALRGDTTELMLERLGPDVELHVIDPVPDFDPSEHEKKFAGRYVFHQDLSVNVLRDLPPVDVALIDGDHNWYTVYNELTPAGPYCPQHRHASAGHDHARRRAGPTADVTCTTTPRTSRRSSATRGKIAD